MPNGVVTHLSCGPLATRSSKEQNGCVSLFLDMTSICLEFRFEGIGRQSQR